MPRCWADCLGECSGVQSLEHLVSKSVFDTKLIKVQGFSWCPEEKIIGIGSLGSNILCRTHNSALSPLDTEAGKFMDAIIYANNLSDARKKIKSKRWSVHRKSVDGKLFERWMLKTLINLAQDEIPKLTIPLEDLVRITYGITGFPEYCGLHMLGAVGDTVEMARSVAFAPLYKDDMIVAGILRFGGFEFIISISDIRRAFVGRTLNFHHKHINFEERGYLSCTVSLTW